MNPRWRNVAPVLGTIILVGIMWWQGWRWLLPSEPVYRGRPLSFWAEQFDRNLNRGGDELEAKLAIESIGTNGIPFLLDFLRARDSILKAKIRGMVPRTWHQRLGLDERAVHIRQVGCHAFAALRTNANFALPELMEIATSHPDGDGRYRAVFAMHYFGAAAEPAIPLLIQCLTNGVSDVRAAATKHSVISNCRYIQARLWSA